MKRTKLCSCGCGLTVEEAAKPTTFFSHVNFHNIDFSQAHSSESPGDYPPVIEEQERVRYVMKFIVSQKEVCV